MGRRTPSYPYLALLEQLDQENVRIKKIPGADHNFAGMEKMFSDLVFQELLAQN